MLSPVEFVTRDVLLQVMNINCFGEVEVTRIFLPLLKKSKGRIVNVSSIAGILEGPFNHAYQMSKFACRAFSEALRYYIHIFFCAFPFHLSVHINVYDN